MATVFSSKSTSWSEHGSCADMPFAEYFHDALRLSDTFNVYNYLKKSNIIPSNSKTPGYSLEEIRKAIMKGVGIRGDVIIMCWKDELAEIRICLDRQFQPRGCPEKQWYRLRKSSTKRTGLLFQSRAGNVKSPSLTPCDQRKNIV